MADPLPVARSPISPPQPEVVVAGWAVSGRRSAAALTLTDSTPLAKVAVRASWGGPMAEIVGVPFGRTSRRAPDIAAAREVLLVGSGPGEWLVLAAPGEREQVLEWLEGMAADVDELVSVVDVTHGRALVRLTGVRSADLLSKECGVDLDDAFCPDGAALRCAVSGVATDLVRDDVGHDQARAPAGTRSYLLHCERSSGQYLFDSLLDAGGELGVDVDGFAPLEPN